MDKKSIVIYFSRADENYGVIDTKKGNTEILAEEIAKTKNADIFKIDPKTPYPKSYQETVDLATKEFEQNIYPEYQSDIDLSLYDTIYFGYPIWWGQIPMVAQNFLNNHDLSGKTIYPFCTHEGSSDAGTFAKLAETTNADVQSGLALYGHETRNDRGLDKLRAWLTT